MDADQSFEDLRAEAMALRDQGTPRLEMQQALGVSAWKLTELLDGAADVDSPLRARAKPQLRSRAQELRASGRSYREIAKELGVSKSSVSLWLRHAPYPGPEAEVSRQRRLVGMRDYWDEERRTREAVRRVVVEQAFGEIGELSDREVLIAGAVAYWCEGAKSKPYRKDERVSFINSEPALIELFLHFLHIAGIGPERLRFRVHIHEAADVEGATRFWELLVGADAAQFGKPNLKRHRSGTNRKCVGDDYRGCLQIRVLKSAELYRKIEGWVRGVTIVGRDQVA